MTTERDLSRALRARHAEVEPDPGFVARVVAALPQREGWTLGWAARLVLPASLAVVAALSLAVVMTRNETRTGQVAPAVASDSGTDPLDWLLETRR